MSSFCKAYAYLPANEQWAVGTDKISFYSSDVSDVVFEPLNNQLKWNEYEECVQKWFVAAHACVLLSWS